MPPTVAQAYDAMASRYAELFLSEIEHDTAARRWIARLIDLAVESGGPIADLGCGPGSVVNHITAEYITAEHADPREDHLSVIGFDRSPGQISQAHAAFPHLDCRIGDLTALALEARALGGIVSRYSIIHLDPSGLDGVFAEWARVLRPGAPALVSFFGALDEADHGQPFDHKVTTAYALHPHRIAEHMNTNGFAVIETEALSPVEGGRPYSRATVFGRRSDR